MKLSNIGGKIVSVGDTIILPGAEAEVNESWRKNDVVQFLVGKGFLAIVEQAPATGGTTAPEKGKDIGKMNKAELVEKCRELGIEVSEKDTKDALIEKIEAALK